jgi:hypothetical protein
MVTFTVDFRKRLALPHRQITRITYAGWTDAGNLVAARGILWTAGQAFGLSRRPPRRARTSKTAAMSWAASPAARVAV